MSKKHIPTVAIVGRVNVGKSTLFNALLGHRSAIVEDHPGVTRDRHYKLVSRYAQPFILIDTGGIVGDDDEEMQSLVRSQAEIAIAEADTIIAVFDGIYGVHHDDRAVADILRRSGKKIIFVINKCEKPIVESQAAEFYALGIDELRCISAAHNVGVPDLVREIMAAIEAPENADAIPMTAEEDKPIHVAIIGRPNVGKSTLINRIIGVDRLVTAPLAGTTRDSIDIELTRDGQRYVITDTAGLRKKARIEDHTVERYSNLRSLKSLVRSDVAILVLDATDGVPGEQDAKLAGLVHERGRSLVIVINKWDAVEKDHKTVHAFTDMIRRTLKFVPYAPILFVSALSGRRCPAVLETAGKVHQNGKERIKTSELNRVVKRAFERKPPPAYRGEPVKFFFATQVDTSPPTFVLFLNHPRRINFSYERYVRNQIREEYPYEGVDIRLILRKRSAKSDRAENEAHS